MDFSNLRLYNTKGFQVPMQFKHRIKFSFGADFFLNGENVGWQTLPEGHFVTDENGEIISAVVDVRGNTFGLDVTNYTEEQKKQAIISIVEDLRKDINTLYINIYDPSVEYAVGDSIILNDAPATIVRLFPDTETVRITTNNEYSTQDVSLNSIQGLSLAIERTDPNFDTLFTTALVLMPRETMVSGNTVLEFYLHELNPGMLKDVLVASFPSARLYPSFQFLAEVMMEPVSTELAQVSTLFLLEHYTQEDGTLSVRRPHSDHQVLALEVSKRSEVKFVKDASMYWAEDADVLNEKYEELDWSKVYFSQRKYLDLRDEGDTDFGRPDKEPFIFTLGFMTENEGCYKNVVSVYVYNYTITTNGNITTEESSDPIHLGYIIVNSEAIGEDERYRTLFANFGIPDPKDYATLFKEVNPSEESTDWEFINKKSKQLFLTYHEIFPYVGTYKALLNAVKFLGYNDIFFREWYQKFEEDEGTTNITYKSLDIEEGLTLIDKLDRYNVSLEEFMKYKKLNKLTLVYRINQEKSTKKTIGGSTVKLYQEFDSFDVTYNTYDGEGNVVKKEDSYMTCQVPMTEHVYDYETDEILAKLYSLKLWLEKYIIGVNARISDITGEGVYFNRYEHPGTAVGYYKIDEFKEKSVSPKFVDFEDLEMLDSSAIVRCTLKEFRNPTFENFYSDSIADFISYEEVLNNLGYIDKIDPSSMYFHIDTAVPSLLSDFSFELYTDSSSGTIIEGASSPLLVKDNELYFYDDVTSISFGANGKRLPYIRLKKCLFKKSFGKWRDNTLHEVDYLMDVQKYMISSTDGEKEYRTSDYVTLIPKTEDAYLIYTSDNKYRVPLFLIKGFDVAPENIDGIDRSGWKDFTYLDPDTTYILYIVDGFMEFDETPVTQADGITVTAQLRFENFYGFEDPDSEQEAYIRYIYRTRRRPLWTFDDEDFIHDYNIKVSEVDASLDTIRQENYSEKSEVERKIKEEYGSKWHSYKNMKEQLTEKLDSYRLMLVNEDYASYTEFINEHVDKLEKQIETIGRIMDNILKEQEKLMSMSLAKVSTAYDISVNDKLEELYKYKVSLVEQYCNINEITPIKVRHLGEYHLTAKAWDSYNIIYTNTAKNTKKVWGEDPYVFLHTTHQQNLHETYDTVLDKSLFLHGDDASNNSAPLFDENYRRFGITATGDASFTYTVTSYNLDTPKKGNYLKLDNVSEKVSKINFKLVENQMGNLVPSYTDNEGNELGAGRICFTLLDENFDEQNLFYPGSQYALYFIDSRTHNLIGSGGTCGPYTLENFNKVPYSDDNQEEDNNYIIATYTANDKGFNDIQTSYLEDVSNGSMECYISNVTEERIDLSFVNDSSVFPMIENDLTNRTSLLRIPMPTSDVSVMDDERYWLFKENQLIKVMFYQHMDDPGEMSDGWDKYITGTTYRVKKLNPVRVVDTIDPDTEEVIHTDYYQEYVLNGCVNFNIRDHELYHNYIPGYEILCKVTAVHSNYVGYVLRASDDAVEEHLTDTAMVPINNEWFAADYIDRTFSFILNDFDYNEAIDNWSPGILTGSQNIFGRKSLSLIDEGDYTVASYDDWRGAFHSAKPTWNIWKQFDKDDMEDRELWMRVHNQYVPLKVNEKGMYRFCVDITDPWGNTLSQTQQGFLNVGEV